MIVLAGLAALVAAALAALILRWAVKAMCARVEAKEAYYFSGGAFAIALAITPSLFLTARNYGKGQPFGMTAGEMFSFVFPVFALIFGLYPWLARVLHIERRNVPLMFVIAAGSTAAAVRVLATRAQVHFDDWMILIYGAAAVGVLFIQVALATVHSTTARHDI